MRIPGRIRSMVMLTAVLMAACGSESGETKTPNTPTVAQIQEYMATFKPGPPPGPPVTVAGAPDPCTLMQPAEIEKIIAESVDAPRPGGGDECVWLLPQAKTPLAGSVAVRVQKLADAAAATDYFGRRKAVWPEIILLKPKVGDDAFWYSLGRGSHGQIQDLIVRKGPYVLTIFAFEYDEAVALANLVVSRLPAS